MVLATNILLLIFVVVVVVAAALSGGSFIGLVIVAYLRGRCRVPCTALYGPSSLVR
jgi:hypothetical protein